MTKLTTHVLDVYSGKPGKGIKVELFYINGQERSKLNSIVLNSDGRSDGPLVEKDKFKNGIININILHTSASLIVQENADPDVPYDLEMAFRKVAPEEVPYRHTCEGPDDMPAHIKTSMLGCSLTIPIEAGKLCLGTWQGVYLCEHRIRGGSRNVVLTLHGEIGRLVDR